MPSLNQKIESLIFVTGRPVNISKLASLCKINRAEALKEIGILSQKYKKDSGLALIFNDNEVQITTNPECAQIVGDLLKEEREGKLSRAALETLAIIAYRQPITRPEIDIIRGVNSSIMLRVLLLRGLVERRKSGKDQRMFEYVISFDFMKMLGVSNEKELPNFEELNKSLIDKGFKKAKQQALEVVGDESSKEKKEESNNI